MVVLTTEWVTLVVCTRHMWQISGDLHYRCMVKSPALYTNVTLSVIFVPIHYVGFQPGT